MEMTLSRALRYKKRVVEIIRTLENEITASNSVVMGEVREIDIEQAMAKRKNAVAHLLELKQALQEATKPIMCKILQIAELKSEAAFLQRIPTRQGLKAGYQADQALVYDSVITKVAKDACILAAQDEIDNLQTQIDHHNATTKIKVSDLK